MPKFRKKPVVIEAFQWLPDNEYAAGRCAGWMEAGGCNFAVGAAHYAVTIRTLEGDMDAQNGDWIIKGVKGEFYPCKDDIFQATYEKVEDNATYDRWKTTSPYENDQEDEGCEHRTPACKACQEEYDLAEINGAMSEEDARADEHDSLNDDL